MSDDFPDVKLKLNVTFPASVNGGTGISLAKSGGSYTINLDYSEFMPPVGSIPDPANTMTLYYNSRTGTYMLAPISLAFGGLAPFATRAAVAAAAIPAGVNYVTTLDYATLGDGGGGTYIRASAGAGVGYVTSTDGAVWRLSAPNINIKQFGARPDGGDYTANVTDAINFANANMTVQSLDFCEGVYTFTAEFPTFTRILEIFGRSNGSQPTILLKNFTSSNSTKGLLSFAQWSPYIHDLNLRASGGSGGSGISIINPVDTSSLGEPIIERIVVSGGDHFNYSFYVDGTANTVAPTGARNILGSNNYFFGAAIEAVHLAGAHQFLMAPVVIDLAGGSGTVSLNITGTATVPSANISLTGTFNNVAMDYASAVDIFGTIGSLTVTSHTSQYAIIGPASLVSTQRLQAGTFSGLPAAATNNGMMALVTDSTTNVWGAIIAGGGGNTVLAFSNGSNWTVAGK